MLMTFSWRMAAAARASRRKRLRAGEVAASSGAIRRWKSAGAKLPEGRYVEEFAGALMCGQQSFDLLAHFRILGAGLAQVSGPRGGIRDVQRGKKNRLLVHGCVPSNNVCVQPFSH